MISARSYIVAADLAVLAAAVTAALSSTVQPDGPPLFINGQYVQAMNTGSVPSSNDEIVERLADTVISYTADGAVGVDTSGVRRIAKASAAAMTLAAPSYDGQELDIFTDTAFAHVITATGLIHDGVTGGAKDTITFGAFVGAGIRLRGYNGKWYVIAKNVATIA